jgi:hypothetical protein
LPVARTCDYHDHQNHAPIFTGRIVIRSSATARTGP